MKMNLIGIVLLSLPILSFANGTGNSKVNPWDCLSLQTNFNPTKKIYTATVTNDQYKGEAICQKGFTVTLRVLENGKQIGYGTKGLLPQFSSLTVNAPYSLLKDVRVEYWAN